MNHIERITMDPEICHGKPVIRRMRYPVELILDLLGSGMTIEEVLTDYEDSKGKIFSLYFPSLLALVRSNALTPCSHEVSG